ncbi:MAG: peptide deformylase [Armatimonadetes bacterium]|nr:peptide deformylase [Armatimonadota bacterium]
MSIREIKKFEDPLLRKKAKAVKKFDTLIEKLIEDMLETMYQAKGIGLAAPQVGISKRIIVVDVENNLYKLINPKIVKYGEEQEECLEGCLSFPYLYGEVKRFLKVTLKAQDLKGKYIKIEAEGLLARAFQHEIDHLEGVLLVDYASNLREIKPQVQQDQLENLQK